MAMNGFQDNSNQAKGRPILKYTTEALMMMLDKDKLEVLEEQFKDYPDGIEPHNFIWLLKCVLTVPESEQGSLILGLHRLFQEIDINGDERMEWSEFTQYIIDAVVNHNKDLDKNLTPAEILERAYSHRNRRYNISHITERSSHSGLIRDSGYCSSLDLLWAIEQSSVRFYSLQGNVKLSVSPVISSNHFISASGASDNLLVIASSDKSIHVYERENSGFRQIKHFSLSFVVVKVWFLPMHQLWIASSGTSKVFLIDIKNACVTGELDGHKDIVLDVTELISPLCVATASLDSKVYLWQDSKIVGRLSGKHERGVRQLDYSVGYLVTVGYEKEINVWNAELSLTKCFIGSLEGHISPVACCKFFKGRPYCVSMDDKCNLRIWDIKKLTCIQAISREIEISNIVPIPRKDLFATIGRRLVWYELEVEAVDIINEDFPISVAFNKYYLQIAVVTKSDIRIYDALTGTLKKIYTQLVGEITSFTLDHRHRIFFLGDNTGRIWAFNFSNGAFIKQVGSAKKSLEAIEISQLSYCNHNKILLSSSWDSSVKLYDLKDVSHSFILRTLIGGHKGSDITFMDYSSHLGLITTASNNGLVAIWDFQSGKLESAFKSLDIYCLCFLGSYPVVCTATIEGVLSLHSAKDGQCLVSVADTKTTSMKFIEVKSTVFKKTPQKTSTMRTDKDLNVCEEEVALDRGLLVTGDSEGNIKVFCFDSFLASHVSKSEIPIFDKPSYNPRRRCERNAEKDVKYWLKEHSECFSNEEFMINSWEAHSKPVENLSIIEDLKGIISFSMDKSIKIWSVEGTLWGIINHTNSKVYNWDLPIDIEANFNQEVEKVKKIMRKIDNKQYSFQIEWDNQVKQKKKVKRKKIKQNLYTLKEPTPRRTIEYEEPEEVNEVRPVIEKNYSKFTLDLKKTLDELEVDTPKPTFAFSPDEITKKTFKFALSHIKNSQKIEHKKLNKVRHNYCFRSQPKLNLNSLGRQRILEIKNKNKTDIRYRFGEGSRLLKNVMSEQRLNLKQRKIRF